MPELTIEALWTLVNAGAEKLQEDRRELAAFREKWDRLRTLLPVPGELLKPAEIRIRLDQMADILKNG